MPADITAEPEVAATLNSFAQNFTELEAAYRMATAEHAAVVHDLNELREEIKSLRTENVARRHEVTVIASQLGEALSRENDCRQTIDELRRRLRAAGPRDR